MERDGFLFKRAWRDALAGLPLQVRQEVYEAIIEYGCSGTQIPLKARAGAAFALIRKEIDLYRQREGEISCRRSMAGRMGGTATQAKGRQRAEENEADKQNQANQANACFAFPAANPPAASRTRIEEDNNNNIRNDDIIDNQKIKKENAQKKEKEVDPSRFVDYFNQELERARAVVPHRVRLTPRRRSAIMARARENGRGSLAQMVAKVCKSDFLNGRSQNGWVATFDWLLRPNNFVKVLEGNYDDNPQSDNHNSQSHGYGDYDRQQAYARRRGTPAARHSAADYEEE